MSNLENITRKILEDAKNKVIEIETEAKAEADALIESREQEALRVKHRIVERAKLEAEQIKEKILSGAALQSRDQQLLAKQRVMDRVFDLSKEALSDLDDASYLKFVKGKLSDLKLKNTEVLIPQVGREAVLKDKSLGLAVSETETVESGFAILDGKTLLNFNFNDLVDFNRLELEGEIAKKLFADKE